MSSQRATPMPHRQRPKIGLVTHYMPPHIGGIEIVAEGLFQAYRAAGYETRWIASKVPASSPAREDGRIRVTCCNLPELHGVPWPIWSPAAVYAMWRLVHWADVLHVHDCLYPGSILATVLAPYRRKPLLLTQHIGTVTYARACLNHIERLAYGSIGRRVLRRATALVLATPSAEHLARTLLGDLPPSARTIANGIDTDRFRPLTPEERREMRRRLSLPPQTPVLLLVGRLVEKKGVALFYAVAEALPHAHFLLVGDGPLAPPALPNLTWLPTMPPERMEQAYQAADALVLPSHGEGLPVAIQEAMATGLPVLAAAGEAFSEALVRQGVCVAVPRTPTALIQAIEALLHTEAERHALGERAREFAVRKWSLAKTVRQYMDVIADLLQSPAI